MQILRRFVTLAAGVALAAAFAPASAEAQRQQRPANPSVCPDGPTGSSERVTQDACEKAIDIFNFMIPQLSAVLTGGNPVMGIGGTLGGLGNFSVGLRANALQGDLPRVDRIDASPKLSPNGERVTPIPSSTQFLGLPQVDAAIGLYRGFPVGVTNVGGVDLLLNGAYIPDVNTDNVAIEGGVAVGYGLRVGLIQESLILPGVSASYVIRPLPKVSITSSTDNDTLAINDFDVSSSSWRLTASKSLLLFSLSAGVGQDRVDAATDVRLSVTESVAGVVLPPRSRSFSPPGITVSRWNYFAGLSMNILLVKLVAEAGIVDGGDVLVRNPIGEGPLGQDPNKRRPYFSAGVRFGF